MNRGTLTLAGPGGGLPVLMLGALMVHVSPPPAAIWLSAAPVMFYIDPFHERIFWPSLVYLPAVGLVLAELWRRRHQSRVMIMAPEGDS